MNHLLNEPKFAHLNPHPVCLKKKKRKKKKWAGLVYNHDRLDQCRRHHEKGTEPAATREERHSKTRSPCDKLGDLERSVLTVTHIPLCIKSFQSRILQVPPIHSTDFL